MRGRSSLPRVFRTLEYAWTLKRVAAQFSRRQGLDLIELPEAFATPWLVRGVPSVVRLHSAAWTWHQMLKERAGISDDVERWMEGYALRRAAGISSPCRMLGEYVDTQCGLDSRPVEIIPYPVDTSHFALGGERAEPPFVFFCGRVEKRKGAAVLLEAIPRILERCPECQFVFAGRISDDVRDLVSAHSGRVRFLGPRSREELVEYYQRASIFVAPSLWDNSPNTIYEAMACGIPVVATCVGGIPELVDDGRTGLLVPPGDALVLADAIVSLLGDPARRMRMGLRGREKAIACFNIDEIAARTLAFYDRVLAHSVRENQSLSLPPDKAAI